MGFKTFMSRLVAFKEGEGGRGGVLQYVKTSHATYFNIVAISDEKGQVTTFSCFRTSLAEI